MARLPKDFRIAWVSPVEPREPITYIRTGPDTAVPTRFRASIALATPDAAVQIEVFVGADLRPRVFDLSIRTNVQTPVTTSLLRRVLVDQLLREAMAKAETPVSSLPAGTTVGPELHAHEPIGKADEDAQTAARIYSEAVTAGNPAPAVSVATAMGRSRAQVARYIRRAREIGLLAALPGAASTGKEGAEPE